ncbi:hypothetical protein [Gaoshiqia sediminis]|uniref:Uncharacterized protein n=1 Tax=Gaoshiqia sediminis TaxID=2986998 RepID=A0AA42C524_9BACT|nr:hypothetical protein [Gaoshiqia sediminis]MCW0482373.1 hypothetical protein [Gaoshiqia sediminis]
MEEKEVLSTPEAILTSRRFYGVLLEESQKIVAAEKERLAGHRFILPLEYSDFLNLFVSFGTACLMKRNQVRNFIVDEFNEPALRQLYYYVTNMDSFTGDLSKGILLQGKYGSGKTVLLETYSAFHNHIVRRFSLKHPLLTFIKSVELQEQIRKKSIANFVRRPLIIDEFGRESKTVQDYGNTVRPISELLSLRSDVGAITHATSNFTLSTLSSDEFYGGMIGDRLRTMFNFITLPGESRRR